MPSEGESQGIRRRNNPFASPRVSLNNRGDQCVSFVAMNTTRSFRILASLVLVLTLCFGTGIAKNSSQKAAPTWMKAVTKARPGKFAQIPPCELVYHMSWNGLVKAGEAKLKLGMRDAKAPNTVWGVCEGRSAGLAKNMWFYRNRLDSQVDLRSLRPVGFQWTELEKKERTVTVARFANGKVKSRQTVTRVGKKDKVRDRTFAYDRTHDLLSSTLYLRSLPLNNGDTISLVVHPAKSAYFAQFHVVGRENFKTSLGNQKAIRLDVKLHKIDRDTLELERHDKFKKATLWISEDAYRMPLEIRSEVFIGSVRATLAERRPLKADAKR